MFLVTAGMFEAMALYGSMTTRSLAGLGQFAFMGLIGPVLASLVGLFRHSSMLQFVNSAVGVIVFTGLAPWDAQRLKQMALAVPEGRMGSCAIVRALALYLDFINLFLSRSAADERCVHPEWLHDRPGRAWGNAAARGPRFRGRDFSSLHADSQASGKSEDH